MRRPQLAGLQYACAGTALHLIISTSSANTSASSIVYSRPVQFLVISSVLAISVLPVKIITHPELLKYNFCNFCSGAESRTVVLMPCYSMSWLTRVKLMCKPMPGTAAVAEFHNLAT